MLYVTIRRAPHSNEWKQASAGLRVQHLVQWFLMGRGLGVQQIGACLGLAGLRMGVMVGAAGVGCGVPDVHVSVCTVAFAV